MAKISVISDLHLGYKKGGEREEDPFVAAEKAFEKARELGSDLILLAGDLFDSRFPRPEHWSRFMSMLSGFQEGKSVEVTRKEGRGEIPEACLRGVPVVAIHGTHERRGEGLTNPVEALEKAGFLIHLHCSSLALEVGNEVVALHGMSGVPEKYSKDVLKKWEPKPFGNAYNIFLLHQDLDPYIYNPASPPSLGLEDLPKDFDCYVSGHIHWRERTEVRGKPFIIPGSLIPTQLKKKEAETEKGFFLIDTNSEDIEFVELEPPREFFYEEMEIDKEPLDRIQTSVEERLEEIFPGNFENKPLVRIKLAGKLPKGVNSNDLDLTPVKTRFGEKGIVTVSKDLEEEGTQEKIEMLRGARSEDLSVEEMGMKMLREKLEEADSSIKPDSIFDQLVEGDVKKVMKKLLEKRGGKDKEKRESENQKKVEEGEEVEGKDKKGEERGKEETRKEDTEESEVEDTWWKGA